MEHTVADVKQKGNRIIEVNHRLMNHKAMVSKRNNQ